MPGESEFWRMNNTLTTNEDMRLLTAYFAKLDAMVNKMTHVFISSRTGSDQQLARQLYE
jgi:hypothetical protein